MTNNVIATAASVLAEARTIISIDAPYLMPTVYGFVPHPELDHPQVKGTMGITRGMVLYYDPEWVAKFKTDPRDGSGERKIAAALIHEAQHHVRDHIERSENFPDKAQANIAGDLSINPHLRDGGWGLPHGLFPDTDFDFPLNLSLEEYYALLEKQQGGGTYKKGKDPSPGKQAGDPAKGSGGGPGSGHCGGIAGNTDLENYEQQLDEQMGRSTVESRVIADETMAQINDYVRAHGRGNLAGSMADEVERNKTKSKIRWQDELRHFFKKAFARIESGGMDFSMARPSKRSASRGFPRPGLVAYVPEIAFVVDTSGSMGIEQLKATVVEVIAIFQGAGIDAAWLLQADTSVAAKDKVRVRDLMRNIRFHGRGGTHFDEALRAVEKLKPRPNIVVYLTDGDGAATYQPRGVDVIWCVIASHWNRKPDALFGHIVMIGSDGKKKLPPEPRRKK